LIVRKVRRADSAATGDHVSGKAGPRFLAQH